MWVMALGTPRPGALAGEEHVDDRSEHERAQLIQLASGGSRQLAAAAGIALHELLVQPLRPDARWCARDAGQRRIGGGRSERAALPYRAAAVGSRAFLQKRDSSPRPLQQAGYGFTQLAHRPGPEEL